MIKSTKKGNLSIMPPTLYWWLFGMIVWKSRDRADTSWHSPERQNQTSYISRIEVSTAWTENGRDKYKTKSRDYMLGSFFETILTAIIDTKDGKAIKIKTDPAYLHDSDYGVREEATTQWKVRFRS